jgi:hypothetical protein
MNAAIVRRYSGLINSFAPSFSSIIQQFPNGIKYGFDRNESDSGP